LTRRVLDGVRERRDLVETGLAVEWNNDGTP
jgi:hypothetical protein